MHLSLGINEYYVADAVLHYAVADEVQDVWLERPQRALELLPRRLLKDLELGDPVGNGALENACECLDLLRDSGLDRIGCRPGDRKRLVPAAPRIGNCSTVADLEARTAIAQFQVVDRPLANVIPEVRTWIVLTGGA